MSESRGDIIGDKNSLAQKHMGLVHSCCKHFTGKGVEYEELFWEKSSVYFVTEVLYGLVALLRNFQ